MTTRSLAVALVALCASVLSAQLAPQSGRTVGNASWTQPFPAFRMIGNVYWVGTADLSTYLVTTRDGHILINTGMKETVPQIAAGVTQLGFTMADVKILTATQATGTTSPVWPNSRA